MEWPKLKNIILIILLITNLFLLGLVGLREWNANRYEEQARTDAVQVLEQNGIHMEKEVLAEDVALPVATVTRARETEGERLSKLLGGVTETLLGGGQYRYVGEKGEATLGNRGEFSVYLSEGSYPAEGDLSAHALKTLKLLGISGEVRSAEGDAGAGIVKLVQLWDEVPVQNCAITVSYADGELISITGTCLYGVPAAGGELELSAVTGVLRFLEKMKESGDRCGRILTMGVEYRVSTSLADPSSLLPVWCFETDAGTYILDVTSNRVQKI